MFIKLFSYALTCFSKVFYFLCLIFMFSITCDSLIDFSHFTINFCIIFTQHAFLVTFLLFKWSRPNKFLFEGSTSFFTDFCFHYYVVDCFLAFFVQFTSFCVIDEKHRFKHSVITAPHFFHLLIRSFILFPKFTLIHKTCFILSYFLFAFTYSIMPFLDFLLCTVLSTVLL